MIPGDMIEFYELSPNLYDEQVVKGFISFGSRHNSKYPIRSHNLSLYKEKYTRDVRKYTFKCRTVDQWNALPPDVIEALTLNEFKNKLDKLWEINDIMYDFECDFQEIITSTRFTRRKR